MKQKEVEKRIKEIKLIINYLTLLQADIQKEMSMMRMMCNHHDISFEVDEDAYEISDYNEYIRTITHTETCKICGKVLRAGKQYDSEDPIIWE